jgi:hypothetical protein
VTPVAADLELLDVPLEQCEHDEEWAARVDRGAGGRRARVSSSSRRVSWKAALVLLSAASCNGMSGDHRDSGVGYATLHLEATDPANGTAVEDFSGAASGEGTPGIWCGLHLNTSVASPPWFEITAYVPASNDSLGLKLFSFDLTGGQSRMETFSSSMATAEVSVFLYSTTPTFFYGNVALTAGGSCQTTIVTRSTDIVGTFTCSPLPPDNYGNTTFTLTMNFDCPLTEVP